MSWIFVGLLLGSTVTSNHSTREACEGRLTILREKGVDGRCAEIGGGFITYGSTSVQPLHLNLNQTTK